MSTVSAWGELQRVLTAFRKLGIPYALGGSLASSLWGVPRGTNDADVMVLPFPGREEELAKCFPAEFYLSVPAVKEAIQKRRSFNIINTATGFKTDIFVSSERDFDKSAFRRRVNRDVPAAGHGTVDVLSAEDVVLLKLEWYRAGGETSERQWGDVGGVLKSNGSTLDRSYLIHWAKELGVADLLATALDDADES